MSRLIDAKELEESKWADLDTAWGRGWNAAIDAILEAAPTVDAEPVRHGRWQVNEMLGYKDMTCLSCGWLFEYYGGLEEEWNYCPNCGAKMDEVK